MCRADTVSLFLAAICVPFEKVDIDLLRRLAQKVRPSGDRVEFVRVLTDIAAHWFYVDDYPETFIGKIQARIAAVHRCPPLAHKLIGTIADHTNYDTFTTIASVLTCLLNARATPEDIYSGHVVAAYCLSKFHPADKYNYHIHEPRVAYHNIPIAQHIDDEMHLAIVMPMCDPPRPWDRWLMYAGWTAAVSGALIRLVAEAYL
jgi:hypothetical protein